MEDDKPIRKFAEMIGEPQQEQVRNQLRILDGLFAKAVGEKDWAAALRIQSEAATLLARTRR